MAKTVIVDISDMRWTKKKEKRKCGWDSNPEISDLKGIAISWSPYQLSYWELTLPEGMEYRHIQFDTNEIFYMYFKDARMTNILCNNVTQYTITQYFIWNVRESWTRLTQYSSNNTSCQKQVASMIPGICQCSLSYKLSISKFNIRSVGWKYHK